MPASSSFRSLVITRPVRLVAVTLVLGAVLAVVPQPAFAIERGVRVDTETPDLVPLTAARGEIESAPDAGDGSAALAAEPARLRAEAADIDDFELIGASFASADLDDGRIRIRIDGAWEPWQPLTSLDADHGPDPQNAEAAEAKPASDPIWVGDGDGYELDLPADATDVKVHLVRETEEQVRIVDGTDEAGAYQAPTVYSRASWGARSATTPPGSASTVNRAIVHHTVNTNSYSAAAVPGMIRSIQAYHMDAQGWWDIGYNFIIDRFGRTWEARTGSTYKAVIGAHALGSNTGSTGIAWLGEGSSAGLTSSGHEAFAKLIAWKLPFHGTFFTGPEIIGHRNVFATACPGNAIYGQLGSVRTRAVQLRPPPGPYLDVPFNAWNATEVSWGKVAGIISGYPNGTFEPNGSLTRAQLVNMLWILAGRPASITPHGFADVPRSSWITPALDWAKPNAVISGFADNTFRGNNNIRRDTIAVLLWRWLGLPAPFTAHGFSDVAPGSWSEDALNWARAIGVVNGYSDGTYRGAWALTRGQTMPMLYDVRP